MRTKTKIRTQEKKYTRTKNKINNNYENEIKGSHIEEESTTISSENEEISIQEKTIELREEINSLKNIEKEYLALKKENKIKSNL